MKRSTAVAVVLVVVAILAATLLFTLSRGMWANRQPPAVALERPTLVATAEIPPSPTPAPAVTRIRVTPTPDPATIQPESLTATLDPALDPDRHAVRGPVTIIFDRPVNATIHAQPLAFSPGIRGAFTWNDDATAVTFTPTGHFRAGTTYHVSIDGDLRGRDGATFAAPPAWSLRVVPPPNVTHRAPAITKGSDRQPEFRLSFNRPMDAASVESAFSVAPEVAVDLTWDGNELLLRPANPLAPGVSYTFTLDTSAADATGLTFDQTYRFAYTPTPIIAQITGPSQQTPDAPLRLVFGYPMAPAALDALTIEPTPAGQWRWEGDTALVMADPGLLGNVTYRIGFSADPPAGDGAPLPVPDRSWAFAAPSPLRTVTPTGQEAHTAAPLRLMFNRPMDGAATTAAVSIVPAIDGDFSWDGNTLLFTPNGGWQPMTSYTVTLGTAAADADGRPTLGEPVVHRFKTGRARVVADFGMGPLVQVVDAGGRRAVQFQSTVDDPVTLGFDLLPIDETGLINRLSLDVTGGWSDAADPISDDGLSPALSWTATTTPSDPDRWGNPQATALPAEAAPGLYLLRLTGGPADQHLIVALSRMTLVAKLSVDEIVVWVSDAPTHGRDAQPDGAPEGGPVPGAAVRVYARNGRLLAEGAADERGVARLALPDGAEPYTVVAQAGDDLTFSGLTAELQSHGPFYSDPWWDAQQTARLTPPVFSVHVQTDRPIYRPGQTVYYKAILRLEDDGAVSLPPVGTQVIVRLRDARDNVVRTQWLATDDFGAVYDSFSLAEGAMLGEYNVEVQGVTLPQPLPGGGESGGAAEAHRQPFEVQEYRKPDFRVTVTTPPQVVAGEPMTVTVTAEYLFGQPVAGAEVEVNLYELSGYYNYYLGNDIGEAQYYWYGGYEPVTRVTTDAAGRATFTITPQEQQRQDFWYGDRERPWRIAIEATVDDGSAQAVSASAVSLVHRAAEVVSLDIDGYVVTAGMPFPINATVTTTLGEPQPVAGRVVEVTLRQWEENTYQYSHVAQRDEWVSGPDGVLAVDYTVPRPGYYRLRLSGKDDAGRHLFAERYFYAVGDAGLADDFSDPTRYNQVGIAADRDSYAPGETARLVVRSSFAGPALLTFQRAATRREMPVTLTPPITLVDVPILPEDAPNIHVTLNAWEPIDTGIIDPDNWVDYSRVDAELRTASVNLIVPVTDKTLTVTISPDRASYAPRDTAEVVVRVIDAAGQPVSAQVALAMVDEAIFLLRSDNTRPLHDAFYGLRPDRVITRNAMAPRRLLVEGGGGGGGGDDGNAPRSDFPDTAVWFPALLTDANGEARLSIPLPDTLTTWRLTARAVTQTTQVGEARATFLTQQDIIVRPILPRELTQGDTLALSAIVHNYGDAAVELAVALAEDGGLLDVAQPEQTVTLAAGETRVIGWPVEVVASGEAQALVTATVVSGEGDAAGDAVELPLVARPLAVPVVETVAGDTGAEAGGDGGGPVDIAFAVPAGVLPEHSTVTLEISRSPAGSLTNGLEFLTGFPYGCVEQTMSRALPNAVVSRAFGELGMEPPADLDLDRLVNESAQRLYGFQHDDGGWGWWYDDESTPYQTAWVVFGLATMAGAGHEIDPGVIERGAAYLNVHLDEADARTQATMLYSLAVAGQPNGPAALDLAADTARLDAFSLAGLALALDAAGEGDAAQQIMDQLAETVVVQNGRAHWGLRTDDGHYNSKTMASATRSTALALSAFVKLRPGSELEGPIVRWLMNQREGFGWGTTNETAYTILALTDHLLASGVNDAAAAWSLSLDGAPLAEGTLEPGELRETVAVPLDGLTTGEHTLALSGEGRLYYTLHARYAVAQATIDADGPLVVERKYLSPNRKPLGDVHVGDLVLVQITVRTPQPAYFVLIEDQTAAGLEPLNERLNTTSHVTNYGDGYFSYEYGNDWTEWGYNYKEIRDGRVTFFVTSLPSGNATYDYLARATHSGTFVALPAEAAAMYAPETWGRSASGELRVVE